MSLLQLPTEPGSPPRGIRILLFGTEGSGKTHLLAGLARVAPKRFLYVDNEGSTTAYPLHVYTEKQPWGLVTIGNEEPERAQALFESLLTADPLPFDAIAFDGLTEHSFNEAKRQEQIFERRYKTKEAAEGATLKRWGETLASNINTAQTLVMLSNRGASIWMTAAAERGTDPNLPEGLEARPLSSGGIRHLIGRYFDLSIFVETQVKAGKPVHVYHMVKNGAWKVKNRYEEEWLEDPKTFATELVNPTTEKLLELIHEAAVRRAKKFGLEVA